MWYLLICLVAFLLGGLIGYAIHYYRYEHGDLVDKLRAENKTLHHDLKNVEPQLDYLRRDNDLLRAEGLKVLNENKEFKDIISRLSLYARHMQQSIPHLQELEKLAKIYEGNIHERIDDVLKLQLTGVSGPSVFIDEGVSHRDRGDESSLTESSEEILSAGSPVYSNTYSYKEKHATISDHMRDDLPLEDVGDNILSAGRSVHSDTHRYTHTDVNSSVADSKEGGVSDRHPGQIDSSTENIVSAGGSVHSETHRYAQQERGSRVSDNNERGASDRDREHGVSVHIEKRSDTADIYVEKKNTYFGISGDTTDDSDNTDGENSAHTRGNHSFF